MAELVTIDGQQYTKREPLGVLGLSFITLGIYWLYWYYVTTTRSAGSRRTRRFARDGVARDHARVVIIVPPFISVYNTSKHVVQMEERLGIQQHCRRRST